MDTRTEDTRPYRPCVGILLLNADGEVFVGNRIDVEGDHWQMPQGGIDEGETAEQAALREIFEETGVAPDKVEIVRVSDNWFAYDLPRHLSWRIWGGRFRGQTQRWVAMRFLGADDDIDLAAHKAEFADWRWVSPAALPALIVPFKRDTYARVLEEFRDVVSSS